MKLLIVATEYAIGMLPFGSNLFNILSRCEGLEVYGIFLSKGNRNYRSLIDPALHSRVIFLENNAGKATNLVNKFYPYALYRTICDTADKHDISDIHFVTGDFSMGYLIEKLRKKYNIFYTAHDIQPHAYGSIPLKDKIFNKIIRRGTMRMLRFSHHVTTCSPRQIEQLSEIYQKAATLTPFPSLVSDEMRKGNDSCPELQGIDKYILFFGGITHYKGVELLYDAFTQSASISQNYKLVITGRGTINREKHPNVIHISRFIKDSEIGQLFRKASCVVYPYLSATMSGVLSIAYYFGTPLVLSDIAFFKENASKAAHLFATGDRVSLQHTLELTLQATSQQRQQEIETNLEFYQQIYADEAVAKRYLKFYQEAHTKHIVIVRSGGSVINHNSYNCQEIGLGKALRRRGYRVSVIMAGENASHHTIEAENGKFIDIYHLKFYGIHQAMSHFVGLNNLLDTLRPDIIQTHDMGIWGTYRTICYAHNNNIPSTLIQGTYQETQKPIFKQLENTFNNTFGRVALRKVGSIGCKTNMASDYIHRYTDKATLPTRIGLDTQRFNSDRTIDPELQAQIGEKKVLLYVGVLEDRRNPMFLIEIAGKLPEDYVMVIVGEGPLYNTCRNKAAQIAPNKCIFTGRMPQEALPAIYSKAQLFLLPTNYEIYGMVILEAMYFGLPVITTDNAGALTIIDNGKDGLIIPQLDSHKWIECITDLCSDTQRLHNMKQLAHNKIVENYNWDGTIADQYIEAYKEAVTQTSKQ